MRSSTNRHKVVSWLAFLLWVVTFIVAKSVPPSEGTEGINKFAGLIWTVAGILMGLDMLLSPETSVAYLLNKRWSSPIVISISGVFLVLANLIFAYLIVGGGFGM